MSNAVQASLEDDCPSWRYGQRMHDAVLAAALTRAGSVLASQGAGAHESAASDLI